MMDQNTQTNNYERPKKKVGRPKGTGIFTEEENKERSRQITILYYSLNFEKGRERKRIEHQATKILLNMVLLFKLDFLFNFHLKHWQSNYILGELQIYTHSPSTEVIEYRL